MRLQYFKCGKTKDPESFMLLQMLSSSLLYQCKLLNCSGRGIKSNFKLKEKSY